MTSPRLALLFLVTCAVAAAPTASAQSDPLPLYPPRTFEFVVPIHTAAADPEGGEYGIWAAGPDYKISFHDGATFVPVLGAEYPHNQPFSWRTLSVRCGELNLVTGQGEGQQISDTRYEYDLGSVTEAWDVRVDGVEQTFVIPERPEEIGDLVVVGQVSTELQPTTFGPLHGEITFADAQGTKIVGFGAVTAIDKNGSTKAMTTEYEDGNLVLRLDGGWLAQAEFPLVVDPLYRSRVEPSAVIGSGGFYDPTIFHEPQSPNFNLWTAVIRATSMGDWDLLILRSDENVASNSSIVVYSDVNPNWNNGEPQFALAAGAQRVVCAFERYGTGWLNVRWHAHETGSLGFDGSWGRPWFIQKCSQPAIGGTRVGATSSRALITFETEPPGSPTFTTDPTAVEALVVDFAAPPGSRDQGTVVSYSTIRGAPWIDCMRPAITPHGDPLAGVTHWAVAYQSRINGGGETWNLELAVVNEFGGVTERDYLIYDNARHHERPIIAGELGRYLVQYVGADPASPRYLPLFHESMHNLRVDWQGIGSAFEVPYHQFLGWREPFYVEDAGMAFNRNTGSHWAAVFEVDMDTIVCQSYGYTGELLDERTVPVSGHHIRAGGITFNPNAEEFPLCYTNDGSREFHVTAYHYDEPNPIRVEGSSCSPFALEWLHGQRLGTEEVIVQARGSGGPAVHLLVLSNAAVQPTSPPFPGLGAGCSLLVDTGTGLLGQLTGTPMGSSGEAEWRFSLPPSLGELELHCQDFHIGLSATYESTARLVVPLSR